MHSKKTKLFDSFLFSFSIFELILLSLSTLMYKQFVNMLAPSTFSPQHGLNFHLSSSFSSFDFDCCLHRLTDSLFSLTFAASLSNSFQSARPCKRTFLFVFIPLEHIKKVKNCERKMRGNPNEVNEAKVKI